MSNVSTTNITGIILVGGQSSRFRKGSKSQESKAWAILDGKMIIEWIVQELTPLVSKLLFVTSSAEQQKQFVQRLEQVGISVPYSVIVDDDSLAFSGPLRGAITGIANVETTHAIVTGCDVITPGFYYRALVKGLEINEMVAVSTFSYPNGHVDTAAFAVKKFNVQTFCKALQNRNKGRITDLFRAAPMISFVSRDKPSLNVNYFEDLQSELDLADTKGGDDTEIVPVKTKSTLFFQAVQAEERGESESQRMALELECKFWQTTPYRKLEFDSIKDMLKTAEIDDSTREQLNARLKYLREELNYDFNRQGS